MFLALVHHPCAWYDFETQKMAILRQKSLIAELSAPGKVLCGCAPTQNLFLNQKCSQVTPKMFWGLTQNYGI